MNDLTYYIASGFMALVALILVLRPTTGHDPMVVRRRYLVILAALAGVTLLTVFRFGVMGVIFGGC